jgi:ribosomal protein S18 acetylase RimI-like enzyme
MSLNDIIRLTKSEIKPASKTLALAFRHEPIFAYVIPDLHDREKISSHLFEMSLRYCISYGEVYATSPSLKGVALWLPSEKAEMTLWRIIRTSGLYFLKDVFLASKSQRKIYSRVMSFFDYTSSLHKRYAPFSHWYLMFIGVDPKFQGKGYGSRLLKAMLAGLDKEHLPCYLENGDESNVPIYEHLGFKVLEKTKLPGTETKIWVMLRKI